MSADCEGCPDADGTASKICAAPCVNASLVPPSENFTPFDCCREAFAPANPASVAGLRIRPDPHPPRSAGL
jgi:hypothetical protein